MKTRQDIEPGDEVRFENGDRGEVIKIFSLGDQSFVRVYIKGSGIKEKSLEYSEIEPIGKDHSQELKSLGELKREQFQERLQRFHLRTKAHELSLSRRTDHFLSLTNSLVRLEPYQLYCVNEVMERLRPRALIADDVGLGKTVEAGLILKELEVRDKLDRVLFLLPAHLQDKWDREMSKLFNFECQIADRDWVDLQRRQLGEGANIWMENNDKWLITSMSFLRQDEFEEELRDSFWNAIVIDEAHKVAKRGDDPSQRAKLADTLSQKTEALLMLSATPHDGKQDSFKSLIRYVDPFLVASGEELSPQQVQKVMVRRGKKTIFDKSGERVFMDRQVQTVPIEMTKQEEDFYDSVTEYIRKVYNKSKDLNNRAVGFAMALIQKRMVSSLGAIRSTLKRRVENLMDERDYDLSETARDYLNGYDFEDETKEKAEEELETLTLNTNDVAFEEEISWLQDLIKMAESIPVDSKTTRIKQFLNELLKEKPDEKILIFTEYKDTLDYIVDNVFEKIGIKDYLLIHGGVKREERTVIENKFNYGTPRILLATDAASEGIDLQESCHIMINWELPWNPTKLEQRIGRLHRYGQEKEVKVWNFQFEGTREGEIFSLLEDKVENIRDYLDSMADVLGIIGDVSIQDLIMRSISSEEPPEATAEQMEEILEEQQQTLFDWYERSLIENEDFKKDKVESVEELIKKSRGELQNKIELKTYLKNIFEFIGGKIDEKHDGFYEISLPESIESDKDQVNNATFDRDKAIDNLDQDPDLISFDSESIQSINKFVIEETNDFGGKWAIKRVMDLNNSGILFNYRLAFEDGNSDLLEEEIIPIFVNSETLEANQTLGEKILYRSSAGHDIDITLVNMLHRKEDELKSEAENYVINSMKNRLNKIQKNRSDAIDRERSELEQFKRKETKRIGKFIQEYQEQGDSDMDIAIRGQQSRINELEDRIERRKEELDREEKVAPLAPKLINRCYILAD